MHYRSSFLDVDIGIYEGHCFYIKDLDVLANHWECAGCQQRLTRHDNYERHVTKKWCIGCRPQLVCDGGKFKNIMNSSEKVFYGGIRSSCGKLAGGLGASLSLVASTFITYCVAMEERELLRSTKRNLGRWIRS